MNRHAIYFLLCFSLGLLVFSNGNAQGTQFKNPVYGPHDTIYVTGIMYDGELMPYKELEMVYVSSLPYKKMVQAIEKYNRLRNAVYVTYPYARRAGVTLNEVNDQLKVITSNAERKNYIKSREKELKDQFTDPLSNLSVYQGKVLMKLINRQTGNNCYEIIKEYRGGINARLYQTVAFFFGSSLKQDYDVHEATDHQIETIVNEIDGTWYNNPYKPGVKQ
jgi:peptide methionine sulfoxide reductase MsrA